VSIKSHRKYCFIAATIATLLLCVGPVWGDSNVALQSHSERVEIVGRIATTTISQTYVNYTASQREVVVRFRLPPGSAVHDLAMWVGGLRSPGVLHPSVAAKRIYREIREARRDPALLEYIGAGQWRLSVFPVLPNDTQKVEFKFTSVLGGSGGDCIYKGMSVIGGTFKKTVNFELASTLRCVGGVKDVKAISHALGVQRIKDRIELGFRSENRKLDVPVKFSFTPGVKPTTVVAFKSPQGRKLYAAVLDPAWVKPKPKSTGRNIAIILDASASMKDERFETAARAFRVILDNMTEKDKFNVIIARSDVGMLDEKLIPATKLNKLKAIKWLTGFLPKGGTDLAAALRAAESLNKNNKAMLNVFMIGDGQDSVGARCTKKDVSPFIAVKSTLPNRPPANCRFFVCHIESKSIVLEFLAESTGGATAYLYQEDSQAMFEGILKPLLESSNIADPITHVTLREILSGDAKRSSGSLADIGFSSPDNMEGLVVSGLWPGPGKRTLEVTMRIGKQTQSTRYVLDFSKDDAAAEALGAEGIRKVWGHQRADRMWTKLLKKDVKLSEVKTVMDFSRAENIVTRSMAMLVLESDEDYIERGIKRPGSSVRVNQSLSMRSTSKVLKKIVSDWRKDSEDGDESDRFEPFDPDLDLENSPSIYAMRQQVRELLRHKQLAAAAKLLKVIVRVEPGQFEAQQQASLLGEYLAMRNSFTVATIIRESYDDVLKRILAGGKWHEIVMQTEPTAVAIEGQTGDSNALRKGPVMARKIQPTADELQCEKLLSRKIPKLDVKNAALKDVLASLEMRDNGIEIRWSALEKEGIDPATPVSVQLQNVTLKNALGAVVEQVSKVAKVSTKPKRGELGLDGIDFAVNKNVITISSKRDLVSNTYLRIYDVQDIIAYYADHAAKHSTLDPYEQSKISAMDRSSPDDVFYKEEITGGSGTGGYSGPVTLYNETISSSPSTAVTFELDDGSDSRSLAAGDVGETGLFDPGAGGGSDYDYDPLERYSDAVKRMLTYAVDQDSWRRNGDKTASIDKANGVFMIRQSRANHLAIIKLLDSLRDKLRKRTSIRFGGDEWNILGSEAPEEPFTTDGRIAKWLGDLLIKAGAGKLSKFSSVKIEKIGTRTLARVCGVWFDTALTGQCLIHTVARNSQAHAALVNTSGEIKKCLALGKYVIIRADKASAVYLNTNGISKADDKRIKKLTAALCKR
jgi:hypothetical protein